MVTDTLMIIEQRGPRAFHPDQGTWPLLLRLKFLRAPLITGWRVGACDAETVPEHYVTEAESQEVIFDDQDLKNCLCFFMPSFLYREPARNLKYLISL